MHLPRLSALALLAAALLPHVGRAQTNATWTGTANSNWNNGTNWAPMNIPNASNDTATFNAASGSNNITSTSFNLSSLTFTSDALANTITSSGWVNFYGAGIVNASAATQTFVANYYLFFNNASSAGSATITSNSLLYFNNSSSAGSATITNNGTVSFYSSSSAGSAAVTNNGSLYFRQNSTASSAAITNNGTLYFNDNSTVGSATITNGASGVINLSSSQIAQSFGSLVGGGTVSIGGYGLTVGSLNTNTTFDGVFNNGALTKVGTGTLTLTNANNSLNSANLNGGTVVLTNGASLVTNDGSAQVTIDNGSTLNLGGNNLSIATLTLTNGTIGNGTIDASNDGFYVSAGTVSAALTGASGLSKDTAGTVILSGTNDYAGTTSVNAGTLQFDKLTSLYGGTGAQWSNLVVQDGATAAFTVGSEFRAVDLDLLVAQAGFQSGSFLGLDTTRAGGVFTYNSNLANPNGGANVLGLVKLGTGILELGGANTYTGATTVSAGTLRVNGSLANTAVTVASGATLGGSGVIGGPTELLAGATLAPGDSPGTLTFTNGLTLNDGTILNFRLGTTSDKVVVSGGTFTGSASAGGITLNLSDAGGFGANTYILFDFTGANPSGFAASDFTLGNTIAGYNYNLVLNGSTLDLIATAAVPEPSTYAALAGLGALGLAIIRRRRFQGGACAGRRFHEDQVGALP